MYFWHGSALGGVYAGGLYKKRVIFWDWMIILGELVTLKENKDFRRLYSRGRSFASAVLVTYVMKNRTRNVRIGITTSKKIGKAVMRNRSRRIIREAYYQLADEIKPGYDLVFVARGKTPFVKSTDILRAMRKELKEAGVLK